MAWLAMVRHKARRELSYGDRHYKPGDEMVLLGKPVDDKLVRTGLVWQTVEPLCAGCGDAKADCGRCEKLPWAAREEKAEPRPRKARIASEVKI